MRFSRQHAKGCSEAPTGRGRYTSADDGQTWQPGHSLNNKPQALLAAGNGQVYIATDTAIYTSTDNGATVNVLTAVE
jgi:hypothetical protein